jgi:hypothetical protein
MLRACRLEHQRDCDDVDDVRAHGRDERVGVAVFYTGNIFFYRFLKAATSP